MRPNIKERALRDWLRGQIVSGKLAPGQQLPTQVALCRRHRVSHLTVQRAIGSLKREGFIHTRLRDGAYVANRPPHRHDYALVFAEDPSQVTNWSRFYTSLQNAAAMLGPTADCRFLPFFGVRGPQHGGDYERLAELVQADRLAGLIFVQGEHYVADTPLVTRPGLPRVTFKSRQLFPHIPIVTYDLRQFADRAAAWCRERGTRRVALIAMYSKPEMLRNFEECFAEAVTAHGLEHRPEWYLPAAAESAEAARYWTQLLMRLPPQDRPEAVLVADDNFVEPAMAGLHAARVRVPDDVAVISHCNFPWAGPRPRGVEWLGFDADRALRTCLGLLQRQRRSEPAPGSTMISPRFGAQLGMTEKETSNTGVDTAPELKGV